VSYHASQISRVKDGPCDFELRSRKTSKYSGSETSASIDCAFGSTGKMVSLNIMHKPQEDMLMSPGLHIREQLPRKCPRQSTLTYSLSLSLLTTPPESPRVLLWNRQTTFYPHPRKILHLPSRPNRRPAKQNSQCHHSRALDNDHRNRPAAEIER
jgi:hypothetical protein